MPVDQETMQAEIGSIRESMVEVKGTLAKVADALERLARLEERHANVANALERAFSTISKIETRVSSIEQHQQMHKLAASWVTNGVWAAAGMLIMFAMKKLGVM